MHTRICRKYLIIHVNIQEHPTYSNCHTPIYILKKEKTHFHAQSVASNFTPNLYPKHLLFTNYLYMLEMCIIQTFIVSLIFIYMHVGKLITLCTHFFIQKGLSCHLSTLEGKFHIIYSFRKTIYSYLARNFMPLIFTHISTHHWKAFPTLLRCKVPIMGQPKFLQTSPYFHAFLILKPNLGS